MFFLSHTYGLLRFFSNHSESADLLRKSATSSCLGRSQIQKHVHASMPILLSLVPWYYTYSLIISLISFSSSGVSIPANLLSAAAVWRMPSLTFEILASFSGSANSPL